MVENVDDVDDGKQFVRVLLKHDFCGVGEQEWLQAPIFESRHAGLIQSEKLRIKDTFQEIKDLSFLAYRGQLLQEVIRDH